MFRRRTSCSGGGRGKGWRALRLVISLLTLWPPHSRRRCGGTRSLCRLRLVRRHVHTQRRGPRSSRTTQARRIVGVFGGGLPRLRRIASRPMSLLCVSLWKGGRDREIRAPQHCDRIQAWGRLAVGVDSVGRVAVLQRACATIVTGPGVVRWLPGKRRHKRCVCVGVPLEKHNLRRRLRRELDGMQTRLDHKCCVQVCV